MYFVRGLTHHESLSQKDCPRAIWLPPPIQYKRFPNQSWWRWGDRSLNVACLQCKRVCEYLEPNCRWNRVESTVQLEASRKMAIYLLSVPCGEERCVNLINILVISNRDQPSLAESESVTSLWATDVVCGKGHRTTFQLADKSPRILNDYVKFWPENQ